ncbi:MAG: glycosyltransferase family 1 protein [Dehalococcoidia bacterium]|nr:glycosyltransferase family 1 protein [Dehalococcoidia bacterium]
MRIGIDARVTGYRKGGIGQYGRLLAQAFASINTSDHFTIFQSWKHRQQITSGKNISTSYLLTPPHHRWEQRLLPLELSVHNIDLLHTIDFIPPFHRRFDSVITIHDLAFMRMPHIMTAESLRYYGQVGEAAKNTDGIIADSEATKRDIVDLLGVPDRSVNRVYPGLDNAFMLLDREQVKRFCRNKGVPPSFMFWAGTIEPRKNLDVLLDALPLLREKLPSEKRTLVVAGEPGWLSDRTLSKLSSLERSGDAIYLGAVPNNDLLHLYNAAWAFIFTSLYEGFGLPPLEAMACGAPVISSNAPAMEEVLGDAPLYFNPADPHSLAERIMALAENESLAQDMSKKGLKQAARYTWEKAARETLEVYHKVHAESHRRVKA